MKVKELLEDIKRNEEYKKLDELSFIRKIYMEIGKNKTFDTKYYFGNNETKKKIYNLARRRTEVEKGLDKREIICYSLARQCEYIFENLGYSCTITHEPRELEHVFNILTLKDGRRIKLDLQSDLEFIQTGRKTRYFGRSDDEYFLLDELPEEEIIKADRNIGYPNEDAEYTDGTINGIINSLKDLPLTERISRFISNKEINEVSKDMGYMQKYSFFYKMLSSLAENEIWKKLFIFPCEIKPEEYTSCIFVNDKQPKTYLYSNKHNMFLGVDIGRISTLQEEGLKLGVKGNEKGVKLLKRVIREQNRKQEDSEQSL